jgi:hypothetical protein
MSRSRIIKSIIVTAILTCLLAGAAYAFTISVTLDGYQVDFIEVIRGAEANFTTSTWVYAITADDGSAPVGMSDWLLEIPTCGTSRYYKLDLPLDGSTYTTLANYTLQSGPNQGTDICDGTYNCLETSYSVEYGPDVETGLSGVKFTIAPSGDMLSPANTGTHLFSLKFSTQNTVTHYIDDTRNAVSIIDGGNPFTTGLISGPGCAPTAINLVALGANSKAGQLASILWLAAGVALAAGSLLGIKQMRLAQRSE